MNQATFNALQFNSVPSSGAKTIQYAVDFKGVSQPTVTYSADFKAQGVYTQTYNIDFIGQGATTIFYSVDFLAVTQYHDYGAWAENVGNNLTQPIDPNRIASWTTYNRPTPALDGMKGYNTITGKEEHYNAKSARWELYDGTAAP